MAQNGSSSCLVSFNDNSVCRKVLIHVVYKLLYIEYFVFCRQTQASKDVAQHCRSMDCTALKSYQFLHLSWENVLSFEESACLDFKLHVSVLTFQNVYFDLHI